MLSINIKKKIRIIGDYYTFNPWIASKGKRVSIDLYNEFKMTEWVNKSQEPSDYETIIDGK